MISRTFSAASFELAASSFAKNKDEALFLVHIIHFNQPLLLMLDARCS